MPNDDPDGVMQAIIGEADPIRSPFAHWMLNAAGPDDWHRVLMGYNWGDGVAIPRWVVRQPSCDRATAQLAFWNAEPEYFLQFRGDRTAVPSFQREDLDLLDAIRTRWRAGLFTRKEIAFSLDDPCTWPRDFAALDQEFGALAMAELPPDMRVASPGRMLDSADIIEGIPSRFWPENLR